MTTAASPQPVPPAAFEVERAFRTAVACHQAGRLEDANALYRAILGLRPDHAGAYQMLGVLGVQTGNAEAGRQILERARTLRPDDPDVTVNLGEALRALGRFDEAEAHAAAVLERQPGNAGAHFNRALARRDRGDLDGAVAALDAALAAAPIYHDALAERAALLDRLGRGEEAAAARARAEAVARFAQGRALLDRGRAAQAEPILARAADALPDAPQVRLSLARCLQALGRFDAAAAQLERVLEVNPRSGGAYVMLAASRRFAADDPLIARMEALLDDAALADGPRRDLCFALGRACDALGRSEDAFDLWARGNAIAARAAPFDPEAHAAEVSALIETFSAEFFAQRRGWGDPAEQPVLIVGMPRSGTTLVEQIVASHPRAAGAGELADLRHVSLALPVAPQHLLVYPRNATLLNAEGAAALAGRYLEALRDVAGAPDAARIADKMPESFLFLGYAAMLLPGARVLRCRRDPMDVGLSCFATGFRDRLGFTADLRHIAAYHRQYERLMAHWDEVLPLEILDIRYEDLVADLEGGARRILDFLGLDWAPEVLAFHETERPVATAGAWQVRQPVSTASVGRWRRYEAQLAPLAAALG